MRLLAAIFVSGLLLLVPMTWDASTGTWAFATILFFVDIPTLVYVLLPALLLTMVVHPSRDLGLGVVVSLGGAPNATQEEMIRGARALNLCGRLGGLSGALVFLIEVTISAHNSISMLAFLPAVGVAALGLLYGVGILFVCSLAVHLIKRRLGDIVYVGE